MEHRQYRRDTDNKKQRNKTPYSADDEVIIGDSEKSLQKYINKLENIPSKYELTICTNKTKTMEFSVRDPITSKIVIKTK
jgi:hypothetical protein